MSGKDDLHSSPGILRNQGKSLSFPVFCFIHLENERLSVLCRLPSSESLEELVKKCKFLDLTLRLSESESGMRDRRLAL